MPLNHYSDEIQVFNAAQLSQWKEERDQITNDLAVQAEHINDAIIMSRDLDNLIKITAGNIANFKVTGEYMVGVYKYKEKEESILVRLLRQKENQASLIEQAQAAIALLQTSHQALQTKIQSAENFLQTMRENPRASYAELLNNAQELLLAYENKYPANQLYTVRSCLTDLELKFAFITEEAVPSSLNTKDEWRIKYLKLSGLFWDMFFQVGAFDEKFALVILDILRGIPLTENHDLPDDLSTGSTPAAYFDILKIQQGIYTRYDEQTLREKELYDYADIRKQFKCVVEKIEDPLINKRARDLLCAADKEKNSPQADVKFCLMTLRQGTDMLMNLDNPAAFNKTSLSFASRAEHAKGAPCFKQKIAAAMFGFLGAVSLAISIFLAVTTFGAALPLFAAGLVIAVHMFAKCMTLAGLVTGSLSAGLGVRMFASGMRRGLSAEMKKFERAVKTEQKHPSTILEVPTPRLGFVRS